MPTEEPGQRAGFESVYDPDQADRWTFHDTSDPLTRFLRDRRLSLALARLLSSKSLDLRVSTALVTCAGVGGEGTYLANKGFEVTAGDFSINAMRLTKARDRRLRPIVLDAERLCFQDESFDVVLVQDSLHHLRQPALGLTEMLRVARSAVILIEPHAGLIAKMFGEKWEREHGATNYVFRWTGRTVRDITFSYLLDPGVRVFPIRIWDHNLVVGRVVRLFSPRYQLGAARLIYAVLNSCFPRAGNMMVAVIVK